jgi:hypothetical protein
LTDRPSARAHRACALLALLLTLPTGCGFWRTVPTTSVTGGEEAVKRVELRFNLPGDPRVWHLDVEQVDLPFVEGLAWAEAAPGAVPAEGEEAESEADREAVPPTLRRLDLRSLGQVELYSPVRGTLITAAIYTGVTTAAYALMVAIVYSSLYSNLGRR